MITQLADELSAVMPRYRVPIAASSAGCRWENKHNCLSKADSLTTCGERAPAQRETSGRLSIEGKNARTYRLDLGAKTGDVEIALSQPSVGPEVVLCKICETDAGLRQEGILIWPESSRRQTNLDKNAPELVASVRVVRTYLSGTVACGSTADHQVKFRFQEIRKDRAKAHGKTGRQEGGLLSTIVVRRRMLRRILEALCKQVLTKLRARTMKSRNSFT